MTFSLLAKVTTIAVVNAGDRMFVGTADGTLTAYECRGDTTNALKAGSFECREVWTTRARPHIPRCTRTHATLYAIEYMMHQYERHVNVDVVSVLVFARPLVSMHCTIKFRSHHSGLRTRGSLR